ncbi:plasmid segregation protein ParM [Lachnospiraceae bacterium PF1-22]
MNYKNLTVFAIDHGNESIKTFGDSFTCGLTTHDSKPPMVNEWIEFQDKFYALSKSPQSYSKDKTVDINYFIYTLFALCREEARGGIKFDKPLIIAAGLPPMYLNARLKARFKEYFESNFNGKKGIHFRYKGADKFVEVADVMVYPQGFAAAFANAKRKVAEGKVIPGNRIIDTYNTYLMIDVGGVTADFIYFVDGTPVFDKTKTVDSGIINMCDDIKNKVSLEIGREVDRKLVENVLRGEPTLLNEEEKRFIKDCAAKWATNKIVAEAQPLVPDLSLVPVVFCGGGSILLKEYLKADTRLNIEYTDFITDPSANAKGYYFLAKGQLKRSSDKAAN